MNIPHSVSASAAPEKIHHSVLLPIVALSVIGGLLFGFDSGVINGALSGLKKEFQMSDALAGMSAASTLLGCALGALLAGNLADRWGRKPVMSLTAWIFLLSSVWSGLAQGSWDLIAAKVIVGAAIGAASVITPTYVSEISPASIRGRLGSLQQLAIVLGLLLSFLSNYAFVHAAGSADASFWLGWSAWRWMFIAGAVPALVFLIGIFFIPESPRFLVRKGRRAEAERVLRLVSDCDAGACIRCIEESLSHNTQSSWRDLFDARSGKLDRLVLLGVALACFQQLTGINIVFYYGAMLWEAVGFSEAHSLVINIVGGAINIAATVVAIALIDKIGRKPLLKTGSLVVALTLGVLAWVFLSHGSGAGTLHGWAGKVALVAANVFVFVFGISWGPVLWVLLGELFENKNRGAAMAASTCALWLTNFVVTLLFPIFLNRVGVGSIYAFFCIINFGAFLFVVRFLGETKGKTLEQKIPLG